jgi:type IV pilus assembly protein PilB
MIDHWKNNITPTLATEMPLGQLLVGRGVITESELDLALQWQTEHDNQYLLGEVVQRLELASEEDVVRTIAESYGVPFLASVAKTADPTVIELLSRKFIEEHQVLPLFLVRGVLTVAVIEPSNLYLAEEIARISGHEVKLVAATKSEIESAIRSWVPAANVSLTTSTKTLLKKTSLLLSAKRLNWLISKKSPVMAQWSS